MEKESTVGEVFLKIIARFCSIFVLSCICFMMAGAIQVNAATTVNLVEAGTNPDDDLREEYYDFYKINGLTSSSKVTITSDKPDVAGIYYERVTLNKKGDYSETNRNCTFVNSLYVSSGNQIKLNPYSSEDNEEKASQYFGNLPKGTWYTKIGIEGRKTGAATVTVCVDTNGTITSTQYFVKVRGSAIKFEKANKKNRMRTVDSQCLYIENLAKYAKVSVSCNRDAGAWTTVYNPVNTDIEDRKEKKITFGRTPIAITGRDIKDGSFYFYSDKAGKLDITVKIEQNNKVYTYALHLQVYKYKNPFKSIRVGKKKLTKYYKKHAVIAYSFAEAPYRKISYKLGNYIQGNKKSGGATKKSAKNIKIKMKKGYKLVKIRVASWGGIAGIKKIKNGSKLYASGGFNEVYIIYKDRKGKKWQNLIWM